MSEFVSMPCACGVEIVSASRDEDEVRVAVEAHNDSPWHEAYRFINRVSEDASSRGRGGPCICKGGPAGPERFRPKAVA